MLAAAGLARQLLWLLTKKNKMERKSTQTRIEQILGPDLRRCRCVLAHRWPA